MTSKVVGNSRLFETNALAYYPESEDENLSIKYLVHKKCCELLDTVKGLNPIPLQIAQFKADPIQMSDIQKVQNACRDLKYLFNSTKASFLYPTLTHLSFDRGWYKISASKRETLGQIKLIQDLVTVILLNDLGNRINECAQLALNYLAFMDPAIEAINHQVLELYGDQSIEAHNKLKSFRKIFNEGLVIRIPIKPHKENQNSSLDIKPFLPMLPNSILEKKECANDAWRWNQILMGENSPDCLASLSEIGKLENIEVTLFKDRRQSYQWLRDALIFLDDGRAVVPQRMNVRDGFIELVNKLTGTPAEDLMGAIAEHGISDRFLFRKVSNVDEGPFYFEGGNFSLAVDPKGNKYYLCGAHNILFTLLNAEYTFSQEKHELLNKMQELESSDHYLPETLQAVHDKLLNTELLNEFPDPTEQIFITKLMIAGAEYIKEKMAETLGCPIVICGDVFDKSIHFHLDLFLAPAPDGVIFIQNHQLCIDVLNKIKNDCNLSYEDEARVDLYIQNAKENHKKTGTALDDLTTQLKKLGFEMVPVPAEFYEGKDELAVNFINSIFGINERGRYCITNGSLHPIDRYLRDVFASILKSMGYQNIYFTGRKAEGPISSKGGLEFIEVEDGFKHHGGIHCRTVEKRDLSSTKQKFFPQKEKDKSLLLSPIVKTLTFFYGDMLDLGIKK